RPPVDTGDIVIIVNADKVARTDAKLERKHAYRHSNHPGGLKSVNNAELLATRPERAVEKPIAGMIPKNRLGRAQMRKLKVYAGRSEERRVGKECRARRTSDDER